MVAQRAVKQESRSPSPVSVGATVRALRLRMGYSLDRLAARAGVSKGALVALEHGSANPTLATLVGLADALDVSVSSLLGQVSTPVVQVATLTVAPRLWTSQAGSWAGLLLTTDPPSPTEIWRWLLQPGDAYTSGPHPSGITESVSVLSGHLLLGVAEAVHRLPAGATATYQADVAHSYTTAGNRPCQLLMTVHLIPSTQLTRVHP